jgi:hypothetical protein
MVAITVPPQQQIPQQASVPGVFAVQSVTAQTTYVFDLVLSIEHEQRLEKTKHPIQTGADISSHAYLMPARVVMMIGMSDAMAAYSSGFDPAAPPYISAFSGSQSKSVSAYQQMLTLQAARVPLTITTRLRTYQNMVITSVQPREDNATITGLKMRIEFEQIYTAAIAQVPNSARPNDTESNGLGTVNPQPVSAITEQQFNVDNYVPGTPVKVGSQTYGAPELVPTNVPGAGNYSSVNVASLQQLSGS